MLKTLTTRIKNVKKRVFYEINKKKRLKTLIKNVDEKMHRKHMEKGVQLLMFSLDFTPLPSHKPQPTTNHIGRKKEYPNIESCC